MDAFLKLGINPFSIVVYLANAGLMIAVVSALLYKPLFRFIDERRKRISDGVHAAERLKDEFEKRIKESETERAKSESALREEMSKLHKFTEQKRTELVEEMNLARASMMEKAQAEIEKQKTGLMKDVEKQIKSLMGRIVMDIVRNKVPEKVIQESVHDAWKDYRSDS